MKNLSVPIKLSFFILTALFSVSLSVFSQQEMVRLVYFHGKDRAIQQNDVETKMAGLANQLLGIYGGLVFEKENDEFVVHIVQGRRNASDYIKGQGLFNLFDAEPEAEILDEIREETKFDMSRHLYLVVANVDNPDEKCGKGGTLINQDFGDRFWRGNIQPIEGAWALIYESATCADVLSVYLAAHELGHAFGLEHDFRDPSYIMSYGASATKDNSGAIQWHAPNRLSPCTVEWLKVSRFFNDNYANRAPQGKIDLAPKTVYSRDTQEFRVEFTGTGVDEIHQVQLHVIPTATPDGFFPTDKDRDKKWIERENKYSLHGCCTFPDGQVNKNEVVFRHVSLSNDPPNNGAELAIIDVRGNITWYPIETDSIAFDNAPIEIGSNPELSFASDQSSSNDPGQDARLRATLKGHTDFVSSVAFSPNGRRLVSGSWDNSIKLWDPQTAENLATGWHSHDVTSVTYSPDGLRIASGGVDEVIRLWTNSAKILARTHTSRSLGAFTSVVFIFHSDTRYYRVAGANDLDGGIDYFNYYDGESRMNSTYHSIGTHATSSLAVSPDQSILASGGSKWDTNIALWDPYAKKLRKTLKGHTDFVTSVVFSPDRRILASGSWDNTVRLWNIADGKSIAILRGHTDRVLAVAFSPDGRTLASGSDDQTIRLWDVATGQQKDTLLGHTSGVTAVAFSPDRRMLASTGGWDNTVRLWDLSPAPTPAPIVNITPTPAISPDVGGNLVVKIDISGVQNVAGYQATVRFDPTALRYIESANGTYLPTGALFVPPVINANQVTLAATSLSGDSDGAGTLATLTFEVVALKPSYLDLFDVMVMEQDLTSIPIIVKGGNIVVFSESALDVNGDGVINIQDLTVVATHFGAVGENQADVNEDNVVDIKDLLLVAGGLNAQAVAPSAYSLAISTFTADDIRTWLVQARQRDLNYPTYQKGIVALRQLLTALTPKETTLLPNYPNPFNPETWIPYHLANDADVTLTIYDARGALMRRLELGAQPAGFYTEKSRAAYWDGRNESGEFVSSGLYYYRLRAGDFSEVRRMAIVK